MLMTKYHQPLLKGMLMTVQLSCVTVFFGLVFGTLVAFMKMSEFRIWKIRPLNVIATIYVEVLRGTPLLLQLYFFYFLMPKVIPALGDKKISITVALIVNSAAYVAEIVRSGIAAVDPGQAEAARCLGLNKTQTMQKIIIPQAVKNILPAMGNELVMMLKETSLASTFFIGEIMTQCNVIGGATFLQIETLIISGILYLVLTTTVSKLVGIYERRLAVSD
ncbi:MAG: amino acid ABC transporter permease [Oscillospiraceae bacterium]|nr:amino acid ABC transporter permease [Oscillospiraceae bacterium]